MAAPSDLTRRGTALPDSDLAELRTQVNNLTASLRLVTAKLDADSGVGDTNYDALITASGVTTAPARILVTPG